MRALDPIWIVLGTGTLVDYDLALTYGAVVGDIEFDAADGAVAVVLGLVVRSVIIADDIGLAVVIEEEGRVDALYDGDIDRVGPVAPGILGLDIEVASRHVGSDHVIGLVGGIVCDVRGIDTATDTLAVKMRQMLWPVEDIAYLLPVDKVTAMEERNAREIAECGCDEEIIPFPVRTDAGVRIPSGKDGIVDIVVARQRILRIKIIGSLIFEEIEQGRSFGSFHGAGHQGKSRGGCNQYSFHIRFRLFQQR